jgi:hypothetical protein
LLKFAVAIVVGVVVLVAVAGLFLAPLGAMTSETRTPSEAKSYRVGTTGNEAIDPGERLSVHVDGSGWLADELLAALPVPFVRDMQFNTVARLTDLPKEVEGTVLMVQLGESETSWTPIRARSRVEARVSLASDGETAWRDEEQPVILGAADPIIRTRIDLTLEDESSGLFSRPTYRRHVADELALAIAAAVAEELGIEGPAPGTE